MWLTESPEIVFMRNEAFQMWRMATALFARGEVGLLIHTWALTLLLVQYFVMDVDT